MMSTLYILIYIFLKGAFKNRIFSKEFAWVFKLTPFLLKNKIFVKSACISWKCYPCKDVCDTFYDHFAHQKWTQYPAKACFTKIKIEACEMNSILIHLKILIALIIITSYNSITRIFLVIFFRWSSMYHANKWGLRW